MLRRTVLFTLILFCTAVAQLKAQTVVVRMKVTTLDINYEIDGGRSYGARFEFYRFTGAGLQNIVVGDNCVKTAWHVKKAVSGPANVSGDLTTMYVDINTPITIKMLSHHEREPGHSGNDECTSQGDDSWYYYTDNTINLTSYQPGTVNQLVWSHYGPQTHAIAYIELYYTILPPAAPTGVGTTFNNICPNEDLTLTTSIPGNPWGLQYDWEYYIEGDDVWIPNPNYCSPQDCAAQTEYDDWGNIIYQPGCCNEDPEILVPNWRSLRRDAGSQITVNMQSIIGPRNDLMNIRYRVMARNPSGPAGDWNRPNYSSWSQSSIPFYFKISPPQSAGAETTPSCPQTPNGKITLKNVTGKSDGEYLLIIRRGLNNMAKCNPDKPTGQPGETACLRDVYDYAVFPRDSAKYIRNGNDITLINIPKGDYTVLLANPGDATGLCYTGYNASVGELPVLHASLSAVSNVSCYHAGDGSVTAVSNGGSGAVTFTLQQQGNTVGTNTTGTFEHLAPGDYTLTATDECRQEIAPMPFTITQPAAISFTVSANQPVCNQPGNGVINVTDITHSKGAYDRFSGNYRFVLRKDGQPVKEEAATTAVQWQIPDLGHGNYDIVLTDAAVTTCNAYTQHVTLTPAPDFMLGTPVTTPVSCHGGANGAITLSASGRPGGYIYYLSDGGLPAPISNSTGQFPGLAAGSYAAAVTSALAGCADRYQLPAPVVITQPDAINIRVTATDMSCFNAADGAIAGVVTGGITPYEYQWEWLTGTDWNPLGPPGTDKVTIAAAGSYRLHIYDKKGCDNISTAVTVKEPALLQITKAVAGFITCYGEKVAFSVEAAGGNGQYTWLAHDNGNGYTPFTAADRFGPGSWMVKVTDQKNCAAEVTQPLQITAPPAPLAFTAALTDYNGFNISCHGGNDARITLTATGGNGQQYNGYAYSLANDIYQSSNLLSLVSAGNYTLKVKDGRGCVVSRPVTVTEPAAFVGLKVSDNAGVICASDRNGTFTITAEGGVSPYRYSIGGGSYQSSPVFSNRAPGRYHIMVKDANTCGNETDVTVASKYTPLLTTVSTRDVSCFGGSDGSVTLDVSGSAAPYSFVWSPGPAAGKDLVSVKAGSYQVAITDMAGCTGTASAVINEPAAPLTAVVTARPVCYGAPDGIIQITAAGGTMPYSYSLGGSWQQQPLFHKGPGEHTVTIKDSKGCTTTGKALITLQNSRVDPNFLVSTLQNAMDTLVVSDVSLPKPDSLQWSFDPRAVILRGGNTPLIRFSREDTYWLQLTAWYNGCDYTVKKEIRVKPYDPDATPATSTDDGTIISAGLSPNPNNGQFRAVVKLKKRQRVALFINDIRGREWYRLTIQDVKDMDQAIQLPGDAASGMYILRVVAESDIREIPFVIQQ
ncbi:SprB repeat-containing protein [Chitinophaga solisilvae]|uniref:SprB repeat-containing protein n=1 Tax=Chitinophaga solisilvae TaxID=1233460 RepID=UPI0013704A62|nr:SprB repeat-containing protein [Chitinophaga solisilvae]